MSIPLILRIAVVLLISLALILPATQANNGREPKSSPRAQALSAMISAGCTNLLVAHYILQAAASSVPAAILAERVAGTTGFNSQNVAKWISVAQAYQAALALKKKNGG